MQPECKECMGWSIRYAELEQKYKILQTENKEYQHQVLPNYLQKTAIIMCTYRVRVYID